MHNRNRLAPVPLPREQPVAQLVLHRRLAEALRFEPCGDLLLGFGRRQAGDEAGVTGRRRECRLYRMEAASWTIPRRSRLIGTRTAGQRLRRLAARTSSRTRSRAVVRRHGHDRAGAVAHQHVVGDPDRDLLVVDRIDRVAAGEDAGLLLLQLRAFQLALLRRLRLDSVSTAARCCRRRDFLDERMLRREHHVGRAEQRVGPRRED